MVQEIVINKCYGGFSVSEEAVEWMREQGYECGEKFVLSGEYFSDGSGPKDTVFDSCRGHEVSRDAEGLVAVVKELGHKASGRNANLKVVEIPDGVEWVIDEYDGAETIEEKHRTWG